MGMGKVLCTLDRFLHNEIYRNHPDINAGGCCVFAHLLASYLTKAANIKNVRVRVSDWTSGSDAISLARQTVRRNTVRAWNDAGVGFNHVAVEFKHKDETWHVDAKGIRGPMYFKFLKGSLTLKEAFELGNSTRGWNRCFNRREIPTIKKRMQKFFKKHLQKGTRVTKLVA